ncbi:MAG: RNA-binding protein [Pseudomonadales bacterium]|jgi:RNA recognition motif-containing protein
MKLFVGNLPWSVLDQELEDLFTQFGNVDSAKVITDRDTGRSRGFGFVEMDDDSGRAAISELNETEVSGRKLTVNEARDRKR